MNNITRFPARGLSSPYSVDSVCLTIPLSSEDFAQLPLRTMTAAFGAASEAEWTKESFHFWPEGSDFSAPGPDSWVPLSAVPSADGAGVDVQFSCPKILWGHNARHCDDLPRFLRAVETVIAAWGFEVQPWETWLVRRLDLAYNFEAPTRNQALTAIRELSRLLYNGASSVRKKGRAQYPEAYWVFTTRTIKFYCKGHEIYAPRSKGHYPESWLKPPSVLGPGPVNPRKENLYKIVRFEEEWRPKFMKHLMNISESRELTAGRVCRYLYESYDYRDHVSKVSGHFGRIGSAFSVADVRAKISTLRKPKPLQAFVDKIMDSSIYNAQLSYTKPTFYRLCKQLKELGIEPVLLEYAERSVPLSNFFNTDSLCWKFDDEELPLNPFAAQVRAAWDLLESHEYYQDDLTRDDLIVTQFRKNIASFYQQKKGLENSRELRLEAAFDALTGS